MEFKNTMVFDTTEELEQGFTYGNKELSIFIVDTAGDGVREAHHPSDFRPSCGIAE